MRFYYLLLFSFTNKILETFFSFSVSSLLFLCIPGLEYQAKSTLISINCTLFFLSPPPSSRRRRYTAHLFDLEQALLYSLSHEAAGHNTIAGEALAALQDYIDVQAKLFPASHRVKK